VAGIYGLRIPVERRFSAALKLFNFLFWGFSPGRDGAEAPGFQERAAWRGLMARSTIAPERS